MTGQVPPDQLAEQHVSCTRQQTAPSHCGHEKGSQTLSLPQTTGRVTTLFRRDPPPLFRGDTNLSPTDFSVQLSSGPWGPRPTWTPCEVELLVCLTTSRSFCANGEKASLPLRVVFALSTDCRPVGPKQRRNGVLPNPVEQAEAHHDLQDL